MLRIGETVVSAQAEKESVVVSIAQPNTVCAATETIFISQGLKEGLLRYARYLRNSEELKTGLLAGHISSQNGGSHQEKCERVDVFAYDSHAFSIAIYSERLLQRMS